MRNSFTASHQSQMSVFPLPELLLHRAQPLSQAAGASGTCLRGQTLPRPLALRRVRGISAAVGRAGGVEEVPHNLWAAHCGAEEECKEEGATEGSCSGLTTLPSAHPSALLQGTQG